MAMNPRVLFLTFELPPELAGGIASVAVDKISAFARHGLRPVVVGPASRFRLRHPNVAATFLPIPVRSNPLKLLVQLVWAAAVCLLIRPRFIYSMSGTYSGMVAHLLGRLFGLPYFVMAHGNEFLRFEHSPRTRSLIARVYRGSDGVMAVSDFTAREVSRIYRVSQQSVHRVYNGVDPGVFFPASPADVASIRDRYEIPPEASLLLTISRIDERKGHANVLRAMAGLVESGLTRDRLRYIIAGRGPQEPALKHLVTQLGIADLVTFAGFVDRADLNPLYTAANLFVMPSVYVRESGNVEGFGLVYVEAGLCGTPSLGGSAGGVADAIVDGVTGHVVEGEDLSAVRQVIHQLLAKPESFASMGAAARRHYLEDFTTEHVVSRELGIIGHCVAELGRR